MLNIGGHVDQADPITEATAREADLVQFFLGDPQDYKNTAPIPGGDPAALERAAKDAGITLYVHAPYVINIATLNNRIRIPGRKMLAQQADAAASIGAAGLIVHGGHVGKGEDPEAGFANWRKTFERWHPPLPVFIENTAGGDNAMARRFDRLARLWDALDGLESFEQVGFCLDTCHAHAGGEELLGIVDRVKAITGRIDLVHANGSKDPFDSGRDRHENFTAGTIDAEAIVAVVEAAGAPVVCETPGGVEGQRGDIALLRDRLPA
jgi:deoxyribonuclease IV